MVSVNDHINTILARHFCGERLSDEEVDILSEWVRENKEEYNKISAFFLSGKSTNRMNYNTNLAWKKVDAKLTAKEVRLNVGLDKVNTNMNEKLKTKKYFKYRIVSQYLAYAACFMVVLGVSLFLLNQNSDDHNVYRNTTAVLLSVVLPDSSSVTLYPQSEVTYVTDAKNLERRTMLEGQAFFKVKPDSQRPFIVKHKETAIRVLGTSFLVNGKHDSQTDIYVREGVVKVTTEQNEVILKANEQAVSDRGSITKSTIKNPESVFDKHIKLKKYKHAPLSQIICDIEEEFNVVIRIDETSADNRISTELKFVHVEEILSEISFICNMQLKQTSDKHYELYKP